MEELNLIELFRYYLKHFLIIVLMVILSLLIGYLYIEYFQIPKFKGTTTIILVGRGNGDTTDYLTQNDIVVNEKLVTTYSEIIKSKRVLNQVINDLNLKKSYTKLAKSIDVSSIEDTSIIKIEVIDKNGKQAADIANKIAERFKEEITKIYNLENVAIVDEALIDKKPYNVKISLQLCIYSVIGFALAIVIISLKYLFNNSIKGSKEIEDKLNLPVLGEVPLTSKLKTQSLMMDTKVANTKEKRDFKDNKSKSDEVLSIDKDGSSYSKKTEKVKKQDTSKTKRNKSTASKQKNSKLSKDKHHSFDDSSRVAKRKRKGATK